MPVKPDFNFIKTDIEKQRQAAQVALDEAARIEDILIKVTDPSVKEKLGQTKSTLVKLAHDLANNVTTTADSANAAIKTLTSGW